MCWTPHLLSALPFLHISILEKLLSTNQKYLISQNHFQLDNSYALPKAIPHECQRSCKFDYLYSSFVYSMPDDTVYCIGCAMFLYEGKQKSFASFVNITFPEYQILNLGNPFHKDAT